MSKLISKTFSLISVNTLKISIGNDINYILLLVPVISLIIIALLWYKCKPKTKRFETVEFYPPKGFNSLEIGYLYKGALHLESVSSLLMYLYNQGYFKIENIIHLNKQAIKITKLKEYTGNDETEKIFMEELFKYNGTPSNEIIMTETMYHKTMKRENPVYVDPVLSQMQTKIYQVINKKYIGTIFEKKKLKAKNFAIFLMLISSACMSFPSLQISNKLDLFLWVVLFNFIITMMIVKTCSESSQTAFKPNRRPVNNTFLNKIILIIIFAFFMIVLIIVAILPIFFVNQIYAIGYLIGLILLFPMNLLYISFPIRTTYGDEIKEKIDGFKTFLEMAEKDKIEALVKDDPNYFYKIYPYAYVLDVTNIWKNEFEKITENIPTHLIQEDTGLVSLAAFITELEKQGRNQK